MTDGLFCNKTQISDLHFWSTFSFHNNIFDFFSWYVPTYTLWRLVHLYPLRSVYLCYSFFELEFVIDRNCNHLVYSRRIDNGTLWYYLTQNIGVVLVVEEKLLRMLSHHQDTAGRSLHLLLAEGKGGDPYSPPHLSWQMVQVENLDQTWGVFDDFASVLHHLL